MLNIERKARLNLRKAINDDVKADFVEAVLNFWGCELRKFGENGVDVIVDDAGGRRKHAENFEDLYFYADENAAYDNLKKTWGVLIKAVLHENGEKPANYSTAEGNFNDDLIAAFGFVMDGARAGFTTEEF